MVDFDPSEDQFSTMSVQLRPMVSRRVSGETEPRAIPFSLSSMIQIEAVPSWRRGKVVVVLEPMLVLVPLPNFGLSPMKSGNVRGQSLWTSIEVGIIARGALVFAEPFAALGPLAPGLVFAGSLSVDEAPLVEGCA